MRSSCQKIKGFSLLELLLVLLVIAVLVLAGFGQYRRYQKHRAVEALKNNIYILKEATHLFYKQQCSHSNQPFLARFEPSAFNIGTVKAKMPFQLLSTYLVNPISIKENDKTCLEGYEIYAKHSAPIYFPKGSNAENAQIMLYPFQLILKITLSDGVGEDAVHWYQTALGATRIEGKQLIWEYLPGSWMKHEKTNHSTLPVELGLEQFRTQSIKNFIIGKKGEHAILQCAY